MFPYTCANDTHATDDTYTLLRVVVVEKDTDWIHIRRGCSMATVCSFMYGITFERDIIDDTKLKKK